MLLGLCTFNLGGPFLPKVIDGVTCLVEPSATTAPLAVAGSQYCKECVQYSRTEWSSSQNDKDMLSAATERDSERPTEVYILLYGSY